MDCVSLPICNLFENLSSKFDLKTQWTTRTTTTMIYHCVCASLFVRSTWDGIQLSFKATLKICKNSQKFLNKLCESNLNVINTKWRFWSNIDVLLHANTGSLFVEFSGVQAKLTGSSHILFVLFCNHKKTVNNKQT